MYDPIIESLNRDIQNYYHHQQHIKEFQAMMEDYVQKTVPQMIDSEIQRRLRLLNIEIERMVHIEVDKMKKTILSDNFKKELASIVAASIKKNIR